MSSISDLRQILPIHAAAKVDDTSLLNELIDATANINEQDRSGCTVVMCAAGHNMNPLIIDRLIEHNADLNIRDQNGRTALMHAVLFNANPAVMNRLLMAGALVDLQDMYGYTALMHACLVSRNPTPIERLIDAGANIHLKNNDNESAFDLIQENRAVKTSEVFWRLSAMNTFSK